MQLPKPEFELKQIWEQSLGEVPQIIPLRGMPWDLKLGRRGYFGAGISAAAALLGAGPSEAQVKPTAPPPKPAFVNATTPSSMAHHLAIRAIAVSPDSNLAATASLDNAIKLWSLPEGKFLHAFSGHVDAVYSLSFTSDGSRLVSGSADLTVRIWSVRDRRLERTLEAMGDNVAILAISPDGAVVAAVAGRVVRFLSPTDGRVQGVADFRPSTASAVAFTPDGRFLVVAYESGAIRLWSSPGAQLAASLDGHRMAVTQVAVSPDGRILASGSRDDTVRLWSLPEGASLATLSGHTNDISGLAFSGDGTVLTSGSLDRSVRRWSIPEGKMLESTPVVSQVSRLLLPRGGDTAVVCTADRTIRLLSLTGKRTIATLHGHAVDVTALAAPATGKHIITGDRQGTAIVWALDPPGFAAYLTDPTATPIQSQGPGGRAHADQVLAIAFSPDGSMLVTASRDNTLKLWSAPGGKWLGTFSGHMADVNLLAISPDSSLAASSSPDYTIRLHSLPDGRTRSALIGHTGAIRAMAFVPGGRLLASASDDTTVRIWSIADARSERVLTGFREPVQSLDIGGNGQVLAASSRDRIRVWALPEGRLVASVPAFGMAFAVSPAGDLLATANNKNVEIWSLVDGRQVGGWTHQLGGLTEMRFSADASVLLTQSSNTLKTWSVQDGQLRSTVAGGSLVTAPDWRSALVSVARTLRHVSMIDGRLLATYAPPATTQIAAVSPTAAVFAAGDNEGNVTLWDLQQRAFLTWLVDPLITGAKLPSPTLSAHRGGILSIAIEDDGRTLVTGASDDLAKAWALPEGRLLGVMEGHSNDVSALAVLPGGGTVISGSADNSIKLWTLPQTAPAVPPPAAAPKAASQRSSRAPAPKPTGKTRLAPAPKIKESASLAGHQSAVRRLLLGAGGTTLVSAGADTFAAVWAMPGGRSPARLDGHQGGIGAIALSPDSKIFAAAARDGSVHLWTMAENKEIAVWRGHNGQVNDLAFTPDGSQLITASDDRLLKIWSAAEKRLRATLEGHEGSVRTVLVTPDGGTIVSGSDDRTIRLWSRESGAQVACLEGHRAQVSLIVATPDGKVIISASQGGAFDSAIRLWSLEQRRLLGTFSATGTVQVMKVTPDGKLLAAGDVRGVVSLYDLEKLEFRGFLFDPAAGHNDGLTYNVYDKVTGRMITYTMPCGSPIPPGATCICNCVAASSPPVRSVPSGGSRGVGTVCTCNRICTCVPVFRRR